MSKQLLKLKEVKVYCLTVPWMHERINRIQSMMDSLGIKITFIYGEKTIPYSKGLAECHIKALEDSKDSPCLIFEDDVVLSNYYSINQVTNFSIELPLWADALYVGTSVFGRIKGNTHIYGLVSSDYADNLVRVYNKLSMHAVIHLSTEYKKACIEQFKKYISNPVGGCDDIIADNMKYHNCFSLKKCIFYQDDGHNNAPTLIEIQPLI